MSNNTPDNESRIDTTNQDVEPESGNSKSTSDSTVTASKPADESALPREVDCGTVDVTLSNVRIQTSGTDTPLSVTAIDDESGFTGVDLRWKTDDVSIGLSCTVDSANELIRAVRAAVDQVDRESSDN